MEKNKTQIMKRSTKTILIILAFGALIIMYWLKSIEVHRLRSENEQLFDNLTLKFETLENQIQAYKDTILILQNKVNTIDKDPN